MVSSHGSVFVIFTQTTFFSFILNSACTSFDVQKEHDQEAIHQLQCAPMMFN